MKIVPHRTTTAHPTLQRIEKIKSAQTDQGEKKPKVQRILQKLGIGKKLTREEINYIRKNSPQSMDYINRISSQRKTFEKRMENSPTKSAVQMNAILAMNHTFKYQLHDRETLIVQFSDAKYQYEQSMKYKVKPK